MGLVNKPRVALDAAPPSGDELSGLEPKNGREVGPRKATSSDQYEGKAHRLAKKGDRPAAKPLVEDGYADHHADDRAHRHNGRQA